MMIRWCFIKMIRWSKQPKSCKIRVLSHQTFLRYNASACCWVPAFSVTLSLVLFHLLRVPVPQFAGTRVPGAKYQVSHYPDLWHKSKMLIITTSFSMLSITKCFSCVFPGFLKGHLSKFSASAGHSREGCPHPTLPTQKPHHPKMCS